MSLLAQVTGNMQNGQEIRSVEWYDYSGSRKYAY